MAFGGQKQISHPDFKEPNGQHTYLCAHCNTMTSGLVVARYYYSGLNVDWLICTGCGHGSVLDNGNIYPNSKFGPIIEGLPKEVLQTYEEARRCFSVSAFTACELICRKILMHVAVDKGAKENEAFTYYLSKLGEQGYITPPMTQWVALISKHGGKATHLIETPDRKRAESTLMFTAELLRLIYEMDYMAGRYMPKPKE
ncbi:MAG: uncharacterized protein HW402_523 [Dehalococcoidales bacterium]|nr:uncharacterized protein [Dehalococcoidales bacterium]